MALLLRAPAFFGRGRVSAALRRMNPWHDAPLAQPTAPALRAALYPVAEFVVTVLLRIGVRVYHASIEARARPSPWSAPYLQALVASHLVNTSAAFPDNPVALWDLAKFLDTFLDVFYGHNQAPPALRETLTAHLPTALRMEPCPCTLTQLRVVRDAGSAEDAPLCGRCAEVAERCAFAPAFMVVREQTALDDVIAAYTNAWVCRLDTYGVDASEGPEPLFFGASRMRAALFAEGALGNASWWRYDEGVRTNTLPTSAWNQTRQRQRLRRARGHRIVSAYPEETLQMEADETALRTAPVAKQMFRVWMATAPLVGELPKRGKRTCDACLVCMDEAPTVMMEPCGHVAVCGECVVGLRKTECPLCRCVVDGLLRVGKEHE